MLRCTARRPSTLPHPGDAVQWCHQQGGTNSHQTNRFQDTNQSKAKCLLCVSISQIRCIISEFLQSICFLFIYSVTEQFHGTALTKLEELWPPVLVGGKPSCVGRPGGRVPRGGGEGRGHQYHHLHHHFHRPLGPR